MCSAADGLKLRAVFGQRQQQQQLEPHELQQQVLLAVAACVQAQEDALQQLKPAAAQLQQPDIAARCVHGLTRNELLKQAWRPVGATLLSQPPLNAGWQELCRQYVFSYAGTIP